MFTILIVDDEAEIRDGLASLDWQTIGYEIAGVGAHGLEALALMEERPVDVILTDIRMPFMDGIQLLDAVKEKYPFVKVIILSGYDDFEYAKKALRLGATDYLLKPTVIEDLFTVFKELHQKMVNEKQIEYRQATLERKERPPFPDAPGQFFERTVSRDGGSRGYRTTGGGSRIHLLTGI